MTIISAKELETRIRKLPITEENFIVYKDLLKLEYSKFKALLDMLMDGTITIEDFAKNPEALRKDKHG